MLSYVRIMRAALLSKEIKISIPQKGSPVPPRAMPGAEPLPAEEDSSTPEADRPISRGSAAASARKARPDSPDDSANSPLLALDYGMLQSA